MLITLILAAAIAAAPDHGPAATIAPFVGEELAAVAHIDLSRLDVPNILRRVLGNGEDAEAVAALTKKAADWVDTLKKAGAKDVFVLLDPADFPGMPVAVVPLTAGADGQALARLLTSGPPNPLHWPAAETLHGALVAGSSAALARIRNGQPVARPELADALADGAGAAVVLTMALSTTQRRALEEAMVNLPPELGGAPINTVTDGLRWASFRFDADAEPTFRFTIQGANASAATALQTVLRQIFGFFAASARSNPATAGLAEMIKALEPQVRGDRVTLDTELSKVAALVSAPVGGVREAATRTQCVNNLKQIALAMHNYHSSYNTFPAAFKTDKNGKPLLSWRVLILPFVEQTSLYNRFHLDEPWDSVHNKPLIALMPKVYACPAAPRRLAAEGKTTFLTPRGPETIFPGAKAVKIGEITDGTSNTILIVDAGNSAAVIWTKPDDWDAGPAMDPRLLFGRHPRGTNFAMADGSVRFLKETMSVKLLKALTTRAGGEVISSDDY